MLKFLVGVVDTELLKAVNLKCLKAINVEDTDELLDALRGGEDLVELGDDPIEHTCVDVLRQRITSEVTLK